MKSNWEVTIFLVISVVSFFRGVFGDTQKYHEKKQPRGGSPEDSLKTPELSPKSKNVREKTAPFISAHAILSAAQKQPVSAPVRSRLNSTFRTISQEKAQSSRALSRYSGWKKAIIMSELMHPRGYTE